MRRPTLLILAALTAGAGTLPAPAQSPANPPPPSPAISAKITCRELMALLHEPDTRSAGGAAIIWLDGYVAGNAAAPSLPSGWVRDVAGGVGAMCRLNVNATRPVTDVIAELQHQYDTTHAKPGAAQ
jgi:hypothetical protein